MATSSPCVSPKVPQVRSAQAGNLGYLSALYQLCLQNLSRIQLFLTLSSAPTLVTWLSSPVWTVQLPPLSCTVPPTAARGACKHPSQGTSLLCPEPGGDSHLTLRKSPSPPCSPRGPACSPRHLPDLTSFTLSSPRSVPASLASWPYTSSPGTVSLQDLCNGCSLHLESSSPWRHLHDSTFFIPLLKHHLLRDFL